MPDKQWYSNKDLFELIVDLKADMQETRSTIKKYNGLYRKVAEVKEKVTEVKEEVDHIQSTQKGRQSVGAAIRNWGGWIFGLASFLVLVSKVL